MACIMAAAVSPLDFNSFNGANADSRASAPSSKLLACARMVAMSRSMSSSVVMSLPRRRGSTVGPWGSNRLPTPWMELVYQPVVPSISLRSSVAASATFLPLVRLTTTVFTAFGAGFSAFSVGIWMELASGCLAM